MSACLFKTASGRSATAGDLAAALRETGAHDCDVLFIHSGMNFGLPAVGRKELLTRLWEAFSGLGVRTLCVPVFTFSFPNKEIYDVQNTPSRMGVFGEFIRNQPGAIRSRDPLMSVALIGEQKDLVTQVGNESCGANSTFHKLSQRDGVKFAFLGVRAGDCFTYMHHLEWQAKVPYRYDREFRGKISHSGVESEASAILNVRYKSVVPSDGSYKFEDIMLERGVMKNAAFGDGVVRCVSEKDARPIFLGLLKSDPNYFLTEPFNPATKDDTFEVNGVMVAM
jgi:aminoglycoside 3-N-acetyltransferase